MSNSETPVKIQIALQGGGAKLSVLLAAMEAVQNLHGKKIIVSRIIGTSAGAIAGCLFAAGVDLSKVRERLKGYDYEQVFPESKISAVWRLLRNKPFWNDNFFREQLEYFFNGVQVINLEDLSKKTDIEAMILATDLRDLKAKVCRSGNIVQSVLDSCALPYCFRVWNNDNSPVIVDGGICENLPAEILLQDEQTYGPVYAISFRERNTPKSPNSIFSFTYSLLNTAINHSVTRAKNLLGDKRVLEIDTTITTFDFQYAFSDESDTEYQNVREETDVFFQNISINPVDPPSRPETLITKNDWSGLNNQMITILGKIYESQYLNTKIKYLDGRLEVQAKSLLDPTEDDFVIYSMTFQPGDEPINCLGFSINAAHDFSLEETKFKVFKHNSSEVIEHTYLPSIAGVDNIDENPRKRILVYFLPPLPPNSGNYTISVTDIVTDFMKPLRETKVDSLSITPYRSEESIEKLSIVLHVPGNFPNIKFIQEEGLGHRMSEGELHDFSRHQGFVSLGWTASNVEMMSLSEDIFKVMILPS